MVLWFGFFFFKDSFLVKKILTEISVDEMT